MLVRVSETKKRKLRVLPGLTAGEFQHPSDVKATDALKAVPGLDKALAKIMEYGLERLYYLDNIGSNVRVTKSMFPRMYRSLSWGCKILDVEEPELYITTAPGPNAWTYGHTRPFITLTSGLVDMLDEEECFFVIAHELGHIKCGHALYTLVARNIAAIVQLIGQATLGIGALLGQGLVYALLEWKRKAELSADRAGLLCTQDLDPCVRTFMKLAGGSRELYAEMDREEFMRQIHTFEEADRSALNRAYKVLLTAGQSHPYAILRAKELDEWNSAGYPELMTQRGAAQSA
jgi:Zn-dependent protease with chaperone function